MKKRMWKPSKATMAAVRAEDVCRVALAAYYAAAAGIDLGPVDSDGNAWEACDRWMPPGDFADYLNAQIQIRLVDFGRTVGIEFPFASSYDFEYLLRTIKPGFPGPELNGLPPVENAGNNRPDGVLRHV